LHHLDSGKMIVAVLLLGALLPLAAGEDRTPPAPGIPGLPVAVVQRAAHQPAEIEKDALRSSRRGRAGHDWSRTSSTPPTGRLADGDPIVQMKAAVVRGRCSSAQLLGEHAAKVREEFINLRLVEQALVKEGVAVDRRQWTPKPRAWNGACAMGRGPQPAPVDFRSFIQQTQKMR